MPMATKELQREYQNAWVQKRRADWINEQGGECVKCGSSDRLEVDHVDPSLKTLQVKVLWSMALDNPKRVVELAKCQVLCYDCHKFKTKTDNRYLRGENHPSNKISDTDVVSTRSAHQKGTKQVVLVKQYGLSKQTISDIVNYHTRVGLSTQQNVA